MLLLALSLALATHSQGSAGLSAVDIGPNTLLPDTTKATVREAEDVLQAINALPPEASAVFSRVSNLLATEGNKIIADENGNWQPLRNVLIAALHRHGAFAAFADQQQHLAAQELAAAEHDPITWRAVRQRYPGTAAATTATQKLANYAWDRGQLAQFLTLAPIEDRRRAAAQQLLESMHTSKAEPLPQRLVGNFRPLWHLPALPTINEGGRQIPYRLAVGDGAVAAASNGEQLVVFDLYRGLTQGTAITFDRGNQQRFVPPPVVSDDGVFASAGAPIVEVIAADLRGNIRWRWTDSTGSNAYCSSPLLAGDVVLVAISNEINSSHRLRLVALDRKTGSVRYEQPLLRALGNTINRSQAQPIIQATLSGGWLLGNNGSIGRLDGTGYCYRPWRYRQQARQLAGYRPNSTTIHTPPRLVGDDDWVAAQPQDSIGVWIGQETSDSLWHYTGDGADDALGTDGKPHRSGRPTVNAGRCGNTPGYFLTAPAKPVHNDDATQAIVQGGRLFVADDQGLTFRPEHWSFNRSNWS